MWNRRSKTGGFCLYPILTTYPLEKTLALCQHVVMVCIYCGKKTEVVNSRLRARTPSVWRRRTCKACVAQFTTIELPDYATALSVKGLNGKFVAFERDKLFLSLYKSLGHRNNALEAASALCETILGRLLRKKQASSGVISVQDLAATTCETLKRFDKVASISYRAYHKF